MGWQAEVVGPAGGGGDFSDRHRARHRHVGHPQRGGPGEDRCKLLLHYDLSEAQLRSYARRAARVPGSTGITADGLLKLLEQRLDNVVFRLGLAPNVDAARHLIRHGHILLGARRISLPSFQVSQGETVEVHLNSRHRQDVRDSVQAGPLLRLPSFLERSPDGFGGRCKGSPVRRDVPVDVDDRSVEGFWNR